MSIAISQLESAPYLLLTNQNLIFQLSLDGSREKAIVSDVDGGIFTFDYHLRYHDDYSE